MPTRSPVSWSGAFANFSLSENMVSCATPAAGEPEKTQEPGQRPAQRKPISGLSGIASPLHHNGLPENLQRRKEIHALAGCQSQKSRKALEKHLVQSQMV